MTQKPGPTVFTLHNRGRFPDDMVVVYHTQGTPFAVPHVPPGTTSTFKTTLAPDAYVVICNVGDGFHASQGMIARFTVGTYNFKTGKWTVQDGEVDRLTGSIAPRGRCVGRFTRSRGCAAANRRPAAQQQGPGFEAGGPELDKHRSTRSGGHSAALTIRGPGLSPADAAAHQRVADRHDRDRADAFLREHGRSRMSSACSTLWLRLA